MVLSSRFFVATEPTANTAVHEWTNILETGDKRAYEKQFMATSSFLGDRLQEGREKSTLLLNRLNHRR